MTQLMDRFEAKYTPEPNSGCWIWIGALCPNGYGHMKAESMGIMYAHRLSLFLHGVELTPGLCVDHLCRNRRCVNPAHLELVTWGENIRRGRGAEASRERARARMHCLKGHLYEPGTTAYTKRGQRYCRICTRAKNQAWRRGRAA